MGEIEQNSAKFFGLCTQSASVWCKSVSSDLINQNSPLGCMHQNNKEQKNQATHKNEEGKKYPLCCQIVIYDDINHLEQCFMAKILSVAF